MSISSLPSQQPPLAPPLSLATPAGRFVTGSILRHILVMASTGAVGLIAIFVGDFANILFLGLLGDVEVLAAIGYASSILFFTTSVGLGLSIATTSLVAPALGAGDADRARRLATHLHIFAGLAATAVVLLLWPLLPAVLALLGAEARTLVLAHGFLQIVIPGLPLLAIGMCSAAVLRSMGDPRRAMLVTLTGAVTAAALDPVFIFWFGLGIHGAAIATLLSRLALVLVGLWGLLHVHGFLRRPDGQAFRADVSHIVRFAIPAVLTNVATPVSNAIVTATIARFGDGAVAGWAVIGRVTPLAFGSIFALSTAIAPIIGQNYGALSFERVRQTLTGALGVAGIFTLAAWVALALAAAWLVALFGATGEAADLIVFYCLWLAPLFVFFGTLFVANAACNTLGWPHYATALNWGRATLGTLPFVLLGGQWGGARGVLMGNMLGGVVFGLIAILVVFRLIARLEREAVLRTPATRVV